MNKIFTITKNLAFISLILLVTEITFGYDGNMIIIYGLAIRTIILFFSFSLCFITFFLYMFIQKISILPWKSKNLFQSFTVLDYAVLFFIFFMMFSCFITPKIMSGNLNYAIEEIFGILLRLSFYFPISFMIRWGFLKGIIYIKLFYYLIFINSIIFMILYFGQIQNNNFVNNYFNLLHTLSFNTSNPPMIIMGEGFVRIYFVTSIFSILGIAIFVKNISKPKCFDMIILAVNLLALIATFLRSMWIGVLVAFFVIIIIYIIKFILNKSGKDILKFSAVVLCIAGLIFVYDIFVFNGQINKRWNTLSINISSYDPIQPDNNDQGVSQSNIVRLEQMEKLFEKWKESPIIGHGFGSYAEDCIRSTLSPYSYEMQFHALLMKTGIVGVLSLVFLIFTALYVSLKSWKYHNKNIIAWLFLLIAFGISVQTNPILFSTTGVTIVLIILLVASYFEYNKGEKFENICYNSDV